jgi:endoglucanase
VTAIRKAGATKNKILLPGNEWTHASAFISNGSGDELSKVTNLDGSTTDLIFDVHQYLDSDGSGTHTACSTNNVDVFETLGAWLQKNKRQAILTETGGSSEASCLQALCEQFDSSYELTETPTLSGSKWTDKDIVTKCVAGKFNK